MQDLTNGAVNLELGHLCTGRIFFHELPQSLEAVEEADAAAAVEITRLDEPDIATVEHGLAEAKPCRKEVLVFHVRTEITVLLHLFVDIRYVATVRFDPLNRVEVLAEAVHLDHGLRAEVDDELGRHVAEYIDLGRFTVAVHILKQLVFG